MPSQVISDFQSLQHALRSLPPPAAGMTRVFRGQTEHYPALTPAGLRRPLVRQTIWSLVSRQIMAELSQKPIQAILDDEEFRARLIWLEAIAQHYGLGSDFLDVSPDLETALWFAFNKLDQVWRNGTIGPPGAPDPKRDFPSRIPWYRHTPSPSGYLYVMDLPAWDGVSLRLAPGQLVELLKAPKTFSSSPRIRAQLACLAYASKENDNLADFVVGKAPIKLARPMTGVKGLDRPAEALFPPPSADEWYARLLSIPLQFEATPQTGMAVLNRCLPVACYVGSDPYVGEIAASEMILPPALIFDALSEMNAETGTGSEWWRNRSTADSTNVVIEAPFPYAEPPVDSELWNHGLLAGDMTDEVPTYGPDAKTRQAPVQMQNVAIQFEELDTGKLHAANSGESIELFRGIWIIRNATEFAVHLVLQSFPDGSFALAGPIIVRLDTARNRLVFALPKSPSAWKEVTDLPPVAKPLFMALRVLRALSPTLKPDPWPMLITDKVNYLVAATKDVARLVRMRDPRGRHDWYVIRNNDNEPFTHVTGGAGVLELKSDVPFGRVNPAQLRSALC
jgi:FRG domain